MRFAALVLAALLLTACSSDEDLALAQAQVPHFRELVAEQHFVQVYREASEDLRQVTSEHDMVVLLSAVEKRLGDVKSSEGNGWKVNFHTSGTFVTLAFKTHFQRGNGAEVFVYRIAGGRALLAGYHINSNALLAN